MKIHFIEENLELRPAEGKFAPEAFDVIRKNLAYLHEWMPWATEDYSIESARQFFEQRAELNKKEKGAGYSIFLEGRLVGGIGFNNFDTLNKSTEIGYWLAADRQGRGIITKACRTLINYCFNELGLNRIVIRCATGNIKSRAIPERLGFKNEGVARQAEFLHDKFLDLVIYSMLAEEWKKREVSDRGSDE